MTLQYLWRALAGAFLICCVAGCGDSKSDSAPPGPGQKTAREVMDGARLKQWTKALELTADQQAKVKALFDEEGKEVAKVYADASLSQTNQLAKLDELHKGTCDKIKPLLNPTQLEKSNKWKRNN